VEGTARAQLRAVPSPRTVVSTPSANVLEKFSSSPPNVNVNGAAALAMLAS
jgi:hypothetical protein